jgi:CheY-like chemotaxis protein
MRILILEDVPADVVLINHELRRAHVSFRSQRVETREDFLHQLGHHKPDVILSDHRLPDFDGFTALGIARDKCPDIPFIFVTSAMGEDFTIQTFESGATDYVLKVAELVTLTLTPDTAYAVGPLAIAVITIVDDDLLLLGDGLLNDAP